MCRHLAYLGPPASLKSVLVDPPFGLYRQSWAPRQQRYGTVNVDGFGVGWYADGSHAEGWNADADGDAGADPVPARYRAAGPIWADESFADVARVTRTGALLGAVRSATEGTAAGAAAAAPFAADGWLFSHNGRVEGWPSSAAGLAASLPASALLDLDARVDSALLWALVLYRLQNGLGAAEALSDTIAALSSAGVKGRFNFLLMSRTVIAASCAGDTLCYRMSGASVVVASEPSDDLPGWVDVPEGSVITAGPEGVRTDDLS